MAVKGKKPAAKSAKAGAPSAKKSDQGTTTTMPADEAGELSEKQAATKQKPVKQSPAAQAARTKETLVTDAVRTEARVGDDKVTRKQIKKRMRKTSDELADLQERLFAGQRHPGGRSMLFLVRGMDTSGKGGIMRHVIGDVDPQGVVLAAFKQPTKEKLEHPFLWRIRRALPRPGYIGVFDRSQYEDVLVVRFHDLVPRPVWMRRYGQINTFEKSVVADDTMIIKVMLRIDVDEQKTRLAERLENPEKFYTFNPSDLTERKYWRGHQEAYQALLERTFTDYAPWFVIPANHKGYARLAVHQLLLEHLRALDLMWPEATFDVKAQKARLADL